MFIVKTKELAKDWNGRNLFRQVNIEIYEGERVALHGRNGAGKTTLFGMLRGSVEPTGGSVERLAAPEEWGIVEQRMIHENAADAAIAYVRKAAAQIEACRERLLHWENKLQEAAGEAELQHAAERYGEAVDAYHAMSGYAWEAEAEQALRKVGLPPELWGTPIGLLSGGQQTRVLLARLVAARPKVLLLDEPTNHLDRETMDWLQQWIRSYPGTVIVVSHDRYFLDEVAGRIIELTPDGAASYRGNYAAFREQKALERKTQASLYRKQQLEREQLQESIRMYRQWYAHASRDAAKAELGVMKPYYAARANKHTARLHAKEKELERLEQERVEKPREADMLRVTFQEGAYVGKTLLQADTISFGFGDGGRPMIRRRSLAVRRGDKLAVVGPNGAGKSTLLRLLIGELTPSEGKIIRHPELKIGYFSQQLEGADEKETLLDSLLRIPGMTQTQARTILGCFLFSKDDVYKKIGDLSMGERCRGAFLQLLFSGANLLVLDEPTNYLDIDSRERMEEALAAYSGSLIVASHDVYFLRAVANRVVVLDGSGGWDIYEGTYAELEAEGGIQARKRNAERREVEDAIQAAELERTALIAKAELLDAEKSRIAELTERIQMLRGQ